MEDKDNLFMGLNKHHFTKANEEFRVFAYTFFTLTLDRVKPLLLYFSEKASGIN
jgi:hypothetical protein